MESQDVPIAVKLVRFWSGKGPRSNYSHSLAAGIALYLSCAIAAIVIFPNFDILVNYVSDVGSPFHNLPVGALVYNIGEFCCGVIMIPQFLYRYRQLQPAFKVFNGLSAIFGVLGSLG
ncbi:MAG TPA: hypothetical protein VKK79_04880, partial [Candidatus Lokiarchaeia archaeon]|nr:hypothetical protein [Candidatus Lokiarchaeia archaeon]